MLIKLPVIAGDPNKPETVRHTNSMLESQLFIELAPTPLIGVTAAIMVIGQQIRVYNVKMSMDDLGVLINKSNGNTIKLMQ